MNDRARSTLFLGSGAAILYFSEGLPFGIVRVLHIDLTSIGLINSVGLAWTLKYAQEIAP
ncbi:MAG TPA: hypothetical protein VF980_18510 [Thermoanaerobaculia bacterium]